MTTPLNPRWRIEANAIVDYKRGFDLDQPTYYLGQIKPKGVVIHIIRIAWTKKGCVATHPNPNRELP